MTFQLHIFLNFDIYFLDERKLNFTARVIPMENSLVTVLLLNLFRFVQRKKMKIAIDWEKNRNCNRLGNVFPFQLFDIFSLSIIINFYYFFFISWCY